MGTRLRRGATESQCAAALYAFPGTLGQPAGDGTGSYPFLLDRVQRRLHHGRQSGVTSPGGSSSTHRFAKPRKGGALRVKARPTALRRLFMFGSGTYNYDHFTRDVLVKDVAKTSGPEPGEIAPDF